MAGCTADPGAEPGPFGENPPTAENPHAVPVEQALEELQSVLEEIDTPAEDGAVTRSEATADVEDLLYIVNFENEAGYAILGADDRLEPVYAVVDEGSLTTEEFRYAVTVTPEQAEADGELVFPLQMVAQAAIIGIENADTDADGGVAPMSDDGRHTGDLGGDVLRREYVYVTQEKVGPLIPVKWGQGYPFNASVTQINGKCCWAGCSAGKKSVGILQNGDIVGCTSIRNEKMIEGNIRDGSLRDIWFSKDSFLWNRNFKRDDLKGLCRECKYGDMCLGGCSNSRFTLNGTIESENILCSYNYKLVQARKYINKLDEEQLLQLFTILIEKNEYQIAKMVYDRIKNINGNHVIEMCEKYLQVNMDCKENNNE